MSLCPCKRSRYLGGSLYLQSLPGVGTCAYLYLKRLESEAREELPNNSSVSSCSLVWTASCKLLRPSIEGGGIDLWHRHESIWFSTFSKFGKKQLWIVNHVYLVHWSTFQDENNAMQRKRGGFHDIIASYHHGKRLHFVSGGAARIRTGCFFFAKFEWLRCRKICDLRVGWRWNGGVVSFFFPLPPGPGKGSKNMSDAFLEASNIHGGSSIQSF